MVILSTVTVNLHSLGLDVPSTASCEIDAAPFQYHILRALCSVTSWPFCAINVPNSTPLRSPRIMTFFPMFVSISLFVFVVVATYSGNCDYCLFILRKVHQCVALQLMQTSCFVHCVMASTIAFFATVRYLQAYSSHNTSLNVIQFCCTQRPRRIEHYLVNVRSHAMRKYQSPVGVSSCVV